MVRYDMIIKDSPPNGMVTDGVILSAIAGGVVLVCAAGKTMTEVLRKSSDALKRVDDGAKGIKESLEMATVAYNFGTDSIIAAPHYAEGISLLYRFCSEQSDILLNGNPEKVIKNVPAKFPIPEEVKKRMLKRK